MGWVPHIFKNINFKKTTNYFFFFFFAKCVIFFISPNTGNMHLLSVLFNLKLRQPSPPRVYLLGEWFQRRTCCEQTARGRLLWEMTGPGQEYGPTPRASHLLGPRDGEAPRGPDLGPVSRATMPRKGQAPWQVLGKHVQSELLGTLSARPPVCGCKTAYPRFQKHPWQRLVSAHAGVESHVSASQSY